MLALERIQYAADHIPPVPGSFSFRHSFQFRVQTSQTALNVTVGNLLDMLLVATSATAGVSLLESIKLDRIKIWSPSTSAFVPNTVQLTWGSIGSVSDGRNNTIVDTSMSTKSAHVSARPPREEQPSFWHNDSTRNLVMFILGCNANSIVQIDFRATVQPNSQVSVTNALVGATAGQVYYRGLDGLAAASSAFITLGAPAGTQM